MPDDPRTPTLDELTALFTAVRLPRAKRNETSEELIISFHISAQDLEEAGISFVAFPSAIFTTLVEHLERLQSIDETTEHYRDVDKKGATAADCVAFIQNELKNVPPTHGLQPRMQRQMFAHTIEKLTELSVWRAAVDAERFQKQREAERKRQANQKARDEEILRRAQEEASREESARRQKDWGERAREQSRKDSGFSNERGDSRSGEQIYEDLRRAFEEAAWDGASSPFSDFFRQSRREWYEQPFHGGDYAGKTGSQQRQAPPAQGGKAPWYTTLGVSATASKAEINKAYRRLASKYHPDRCKDADAGAKMAEINAARDLGML